MVLCFSLARLKADWERKAESWNGRNPYLFNVNIRNHRGVHNAKPTRGLNSFRLITNRHGQSRWKAYAKFVRLWFPRRPKKSFRTEHCVRSLINVSIKLANFLAEMKRTRWRGKEKIPIIAADCKQYDTKSHHKDEWRYLGFFNAAIPSIPSSRPATKQEISRKILQRWRFRVNDITRHHRSNIYLRRFFSRRSPSFFFLRALATCKILWMINGTHTLRCRRSACANWICVKRNRCAMSLLLFASCVRTHSRETIDSIIANLPSPRELEPCVEGQHRHRSLSLSGAINCKI